MIIMETFPCIFRISLKKSSPKLDFSGETRNDPVDRDQVFKT